MSEQRKVKGSVVQDMAKLVRVFRNEPWDRYLTPDDMKLVDSMILPTAWYPLDFYHRLGLAVYKLVAKENVEVVRSFGRAAVQEMFESPYRRFLLCGDPFAAVQKFLDLRRGLFNFSQMGMEKTSGQSLRLWITDIGSTGEGYEVFNHLIGVQLQMIVEANGGQKVKAVPRQAPQGDGLVFEVEVTWQPG